MLLPDDPAKRPQLWSCLATQLAEQPVCLAVGNGEGNLPAQASLMSEQTASALLNRLRSAQVCRISANRGRAISPHFAGHTVRNAILITEFIFLPSSSGAISPELLIRELETAVINLFCTEKIVSEVRVPLRLSPWQMSDVDVVRGTDGLFFVKKII